jgi:hypothetical protein
VGDLVVDADSGIAERMSKAEAILRERIDGRIRLSLVDEVGSTVVIRGHLPA